MVILKKGAKIYTISETYTLEEQIGQGGNGCVFSAVSSDGTEFAIKFVDRAKSKETLKRLKNEISFCKKHKHKNIIQVLEYGCIEDKYIFYIMPMYEDTLRKRIDKGINPEDAIEIFINILQGLKYTHSHECFHRDIKPENILLRAGSNEAIIADFGIAHIPKEDAVTTVETKPSSRMANFQYAAPEQRMKGEKIDGRADVYALGLILNEMFTHKLPIGNQYKTISDMCEEYGYMDRIVEKLCCQEPDDRLYPIRDIMLEISVLENQKRIDRQKKSIGEYSFFEDEIVIIDAPKIVDGIYEAGKLKIQLSNNMPDEWFSILHNGDFGHTSLWGYNTDKVSGKENIIFMRLRGDESENNLRSILTELKAWLAPVTEKYNKIMEKRKMEEIEREKVKREKQLQEMEKEQSIKGILKDLI